jgi:hypothetical protein
MPSDNSRLVLPLMTGSGDFQLQVLCLQICPVSPTQGNAL